jgi:KDO2-lipid IV(A) lauroyltransferase
VEFLAYVLARALFTAVQMFPWRTAAELARWIGPIWRRLDRKHSAIARRNLERARGIVRPQEIPAFLDRVYENLALALIEILMAPRLIAGKRLARVARLETWDRMERLLAEGRGVILVIGHLGNYELSGLAVTQAGFPLHSLARPVVNRWLDRYLMSQRTRTGQRILPFDRGLREMIRILRSNGILTIQMDLDAKEAGLVVDFLGRPASVHRTPAALSLKYGSPIILADTFREAGVNHCILGAPLRPEEFRGAPDPERALTERVTAELERLVRAHPDQWLWLLDRWRSVERAAARAGDRAPSPSVN